MRLNAFETVQAVGLALPDVEVAVRYDGSPVLKAAGCFMAGLALIPRPSRKRSLSDSTSPIEKRCSKMPPRPIT